LFSDSQNFRYVTYMIHYGS